jgi:hypothetical protein
MAQSRLHKGLRRQLLCFEELGSLEPQAPPGLHGDVCGQGQGGSSHPPYFHGGYRVLVLGLGLTHHLSPSVSVTWATTQVRGPH